MLLAAAEQSAMGVQSFTQNWKKYKNAFKVGAHSGNVASVLRSEVEVFFHRQFCKHMPAFRHHRHALTDHGRRR